MSRALNYANAYLANELSSFSGSTRNVLLVPSGIIKSTTRMFIYLVLPSTCNSITNKSKNVNKEKNKWGLLRQKTCLDYRKSFELPVLKNKLTDRTCWYKKPFVRRLQLVSLNWKFRKIWTFSWLALIWNF